MSAPGNIRRLRLGVKDNWRTPPELFRAVEKRLGIKFTTDLAADATNHLCEHWIGEEEDALKTPWPRYEWSWCNPPYSRTKEFIVRAIEQWRPSALLVPAATDTRWWAEAFGAADVTLLLTGRVPFHSPETGKPVNGNTTGSTIFVFGSFFTHSVSVWDWKKDL